KVQTSCRRGNRTPLTRKNTLIPLAVIGISRTVNVRRKRYIAPPLEEFKRRGGKFDTPQVALTTEHAHNASCRCHLEPFAYRFACTQLYNSLSRLDDTLQEYLHATAGRLRPHEPRCNHFRIVENEEIARTQEAGEVAHGAVARNWRTIRPVENKQPTRRSLGERSLGDQFGRQEVGEVMALHARMVFQSPSRRDESAFAPLIRSSRWSPCELF
ncbi:MAG: hypothetical protein JWO52_5838, partial [Gammaproteobacteria bacterium]|nr:hypothetical protein [Gammaproteobacteria bacterium]